MIRRKVAIKNHMNFHTNVSSCWIQLTFIVHLLCSYTKIRDLLSMLLEALLGRCHMVIPVSRGLWRLMTRRAGYQNTVLLASHTAHKFENTEFHDLSSLQSGSGSMSVSLLCSAARGYVTCVFL